jgi:hypothetical protein
MAHFYIMHSHCTSLLFIHHHWDSVFELEATSHRVMLSSVYRQVWYSETHSTSVNKLTTTAGSRTYARIYWPKKNEEYSIVTLSERALETTQSLIQWVYWFLSRSKTDGEWSWPKRLSSAELRTGEARVKLYFTPLYVFIAFKAKYLKNGLWLSDIQNARARQDFKHQWLVWNSYRKIF